MTEDQEYARWFPGYEKPHRGRKQFYILYDWPDSIKVCGPYTFVQAAAIRPQLDRSEIWTRKELNDDDEFVKALREWEASGDADQRRVQGGAG